MAKKKRQPQKDNREPLQRGPRGDFIGDLERGKHFWLYYAGATLIFTIILFNKFIFSAATEMLYSSDTIQAGIFFRQFITEYIKTHFAVPQWNPYIFGGMPPVDAFHGDIFYLPTLILKELWPVNEVYRAFGWGLVLHVYLAGLFAYLSARGFGLSKLASAFAGVAYMFSGYLVSMVAPGHDGKMFVTALFPLAFYFLNRGTQTLQLKWFISLGLTIAFIILTPHPQMAYFSLWALGFWFGYQVILMLVDKRGIARTGGLVVMFVLAVVIGLAGSAIQMLPSYKYIQEFSPRAGEGAEGRGGYEWATSWDMNPEEAVGQVIPFFPGVDDGKDAGGYWGKNPFKDNTEYAGFFPLLLGIVGIFLWPRRETWFLLALAAFALIYALGDTTPIFHLFFAVIPNVSKMRAPSMIMFLFAFSFTMLAAFGLDAIRSLRENAGAMTREKLNRALIIFAGVLTLAAILFTFAGEGLMSVYKSIFYTQITPDNQQAMIGTLGTIKTSLWLITILTWIAIFIIRAYMGRALGQAAIAALIFISLVDLWRVDFRFIDTAPFAQFFPRAPVVDMLESQPGPFRVINLTRQSFSSKNYFAMNHIQQLTGYHGAQLKSFDEFVGGLSFRHLMGPSGLLKPAFQLTNTRYVVVDQNVGLPKEEGYTRVYGREVNVFEVPGVLPRATIFHQYEVVEDDTTSLNRLLSPDYPYLSTLMLYEEPEPRPQLPDSTARESAEVVSYEIEQQTYRVTLAAPGLLFVSDNDFPGWKVRVDGTTQPILKANHTFRAVALPAGTHEVQFYWDWPRFQTGKWITLLTFAVSILGLVALVIVGRKKNTTGDQATGGNTA